MRVMVTGAAGWLGGFLTDRLRAAGHEVAGLDLVAGRPGMLAADISDTAALTRELPEHGYDWVVHAAALLAGSAEELQRVNVRGTGVLADWCRRTGTGLLFVSSCAVYSGYHEGVIDERTPARAVEDYGQTKLAAEMVVRQLPRWIIVNPTNLFGEGRAEPALDSKLAKRRPLYLNVPGTSPHLLYAGDFADMVAALLAEPRAVGEQFIAGEREEYSGYPALYQALAAASGRPVMTGIPVPRPLAALPGLRSVVTDDFRRFNAGKLVARLGCVYRCGLQTGVARYVRWIGQDGVTGGQGTAGHG